MNKLFGLPVGLVTIILVAALGVALATIGTLAARNRVFFRLGVRNARRRPARAALIVAGSMLGTTIIAAALATGDTMSQTIRSAAVTSIGRADEVVAARGVDAPLAPESTGAAGVRYFPQQDADRIARAAAGSGLVDGVAPVIVEPIAVQDVTSRQNEPRVTLFASDSRKLRAFGPMRAGGRTVSLADLRPGQVYLNAKAASSLAAHAGDSLRILVGTTTAVVRVRDVISYQGSGTSDQGLLMPLGPAQRLLGKPGLIKLVFVANHGGVGATDRVISLLQPSLAPLGLEADNSKQDALELADTQGAAFMSMFTTFGSFSIAAGILLIFLIFVMLAAERRAELGIARAIGTRRSHLVQMFLYEGLAYDLLAAAVGALLGIAVAYVMVLAMAAAFSASADVTITYAIKPTSVVIAYAVGVLLTLAVVAFSAWRVSRMNIVTAIRNLPEPPAANARRSRWLPGAVGLLLGAFLVFSGVTSKDGIVLGFGVLFVALGLVPIARALGASDRLVYTTAGLALVAWFVLPMSRWLLGDLKTNFSMFILSGLAIVVGASWALMYNADALLGALTATVGRNRRLAPVLKLSLAYPLASRFRTGVTLAMFTLVVFTLVTGAITTGSFVSGFNNIDTFGGGFDIRATTAPASPIRNMSAAVARAPGVRPGDIRLVSDQSFLPVKAHQAGSGSRPESYFVHGADATFLDHTTYSFAAMASGYESPAAVWRALRRRPNLAVVDSLVVPRKQNYSFGATSKFRLRGFYLEDRPFRPISVDVRDPQSGRSVRLTIIAVLSDRAPLTMAGIWTSQRTLATAFGSRVVPTVHLFALKPGVDSVRMAATLESDFLANGMQADAVKKLLADGVSASLTFDRLIEGFMGLGLIVGVAALGVVTTRSVVERRQQIGVLRAIGFRRRMVQGCFLLESSFVALTAIVVGTALGLAVAYNVIADTRRQPSWSGLPFHVPWLTLALIFFVVYAVAMLTTLAPARRASRVYPAEALRYQ
jgi:putative ABC transport system permease protein